MNSTFRLMILAIATLAIAGCATMFGRNKDLVELTSEPEGADVFYLGKKLGTTPFSIEFPRNTNATFITVKKEGYEPKQVQLLKKVAAVSFLNFGFTTTTTGVTSWGIDMSTGRMWEYQPNSYVVHLYKRSADLWNERVFEFVLTNGHNLRTDLAREDGPAMESFCKLLKKDQPSCQSFAKRAKNADETEPTRLAIFSVRNNLELYRQLHELDRGVF